MNRTTIITEISKWTAKSKAALSSALKRARIRHSKHELKWAYIKWSRIMAEYSCGMSLTRYVSPRTNVLERRMIRHAQRLRDMGEAVPAVPGEPDFAKPKEELRVL